MLMRSSDVRVICMPRAARETLRSVLSPARRHGLAVGCRHASSSSLPDEVDTVVVGAGCVGLAIAHQLTKSLSNSSLLVIDKEASIGSVTSSQAAGLVGQMRTGGVDRIRLAMRSVAEYSALQAEPNESLPRPGWRQCGSIRVAQTQARAAEDEKLKKMCDDAGLQTHWLTPEEASKLWPGLSFSCVGRKSLPGLAGDHPNEAHSILYCPTDGYLQPYDLCATYQAHARQNGAQFATGTSLLDVTLSADGSQVDGVVTSRGEVRCSRVINAAGAHAYHVAKLAMPEHDFPLFPVRHASVVTRPFEPEPGVVIRPDNPVVRAVDSTIYMRPDVNSMLLGGFEPRGHGRSCDPSKDFAADEQPPDLLAEPDWDILGSFLNGTASLCPAVLNAPLRDVQAGWPCFTPDGRFVIGESDSGPDGFVFAAGCNAHGVSGSAGLAWAVTEAVSLPVAQHSEYLRSLSPDRFGSAMLGGGVDSAGWQAARLASQQVLEDYYAPSSVL